MRSTASRFISALALELQPVDGLSAMGGHRNRSLAVIGSWSMANQLIQTGIRLFGTVILSRLLGPETFGLMAMVLFFQGIIGNFNNLGFGDAGIQAPDMSFPQISGIYWITFVVSGILGLILAISGPFIGAFYGQPALIWIAVLLGITLWIDGTNCADWIILSRNRKSELSTVVLTVGSLLGLLVSVVLALGGRGVWSLVFGTLATSIVQKGMLAYFVQWRPDKPRRGVGMRKFMSYGLRAMSNGIAFFLSQNCQTLVLGKYATPSAVGFFNRGQTLFQTPVLQVTTSLGSSLYLSMCAVQNDRNALFRLVIRATWLFGIIIYPFTIWMICYGDWIISWLIGDAWIEAGVVAQLLAAGSVLGVLLSAIYRANFAIGRPARGTLVTLWSIPVLIAGVFCFGHRGAIAVASWFAVYRTILFIPSVWIYFKGAEMSMWQFLRSSSILLLFSIMIGVFLWGMRNLVEFQDVQIRIAIVSALLIASYAIFFIGYRFFAAGREVLCWTYTNFGKRLGLPFRLFGDRPKNDAI